jgi:hypothetical protein
MNSAAEPSFPSFFVGPSFAFMQKAKGKRGLFALSFCERKIMEERSASEAHTWQGLSRLWASPQRRWHERFVELLRNGYFSLRSKDYVEVAKALKMDVPDLKKCKEKVSQLLRKLSALGLYEVLGAGEYRLNPHILAYALEIERLPDGSIANINELVSKIKNAVMGLRGKHKRYKEGKGTRAEEKSTED